MSTQNLAIAKAGIAVSKAAETYQNAADDLAARILELADLRGLDGTETAEAVRGAALPIATACTTLGNISARDGLKAHRERN